MFEIGLMPCAARLKPPYALSGMLKAEGKCKQDVRN